MIRSWWYRRKQRQLAPGGHGIWPPNLRTLEYQQALDDVRWEMRLLGGDNRLRWLLEDAIDGERYDRPFR